VDEDHGSTYRSRAGTLAFTGALNPAGLARLIGSFFQSPWSYKERIGISDHKTLLPVIGEAGWNETVRLPKMSAVVTY
jgi:hypothetical protein